MIEKLIYRTPLLKLSELVSTEKDLLLAYQKTEVREALYIASNDLYNELILLETDSTTSEQEKNKVLINLYKYYTRMCTRCTPFGLFSGINIATFSEENNIVFNSHLQPRIRIDMDYLCNLFYEINKDKSLWNSLVFYPNNTLYKVNAQWRYVEYQFDKNIRLHNLVSIDNNEALSLLIEKAITGKKIDELIEILIEFDISVQEAKEYLSELILSQVLISSLYPSISGTEYQTRLFTELEKADPHKFSKINSKINSILKEETSSIIQKNTSIKELLSPLIEKNNSKFILQVDLFKPVEECSIDSKIKKEIIETTNILRRLKIPNDIDNVFENFKVAFSERYEDKFIPLSIVMDTDIGIGYKRAISIANTHHLKRTSPAEEDIKSFKLKIYTNAIKSGLKNVEISAEEISNFKKHESKPLANSFGFVGNLFTNRDNTVGLRYKNIGGSSAINLIGRFGHLNTEIESLCNDMCIKDDAFYSNTIVAEIVHLPQGKVGNITTRPHYRSYEIPYLSYSTVPWENQVLIKDLYIGLVNNNFILFSRKHNKQIIPRLSNAHNYSFDGLPVYHFLGDLQYQNIEEGVYWSWDDLSIAEYLPRVTINNTIVSLQRWRISTINFKAKNIQNNFGVVEQKLKELNIPSEFLIIEGDNELYINIQSKLGVQTYLKYCENIDIIIIEEFLYHSENPVAGFTNEIIVPFIGETSIKNEGVANIKVELDELATEYFSPFSKWIFLKIYTGQKFAQRLLLNEIPEILKKAKDNNLITKWFFIRYSDPKFHLRLRLCLLNEDDISKLFSLLGQSFENDLKSKFIWNLEIGTYKPELNRYGHNTIIESEDWFFYNSELVIKLLPIFEKMTDDEKIIYAALFVDGLLSQFSYTLEKKYSYALKCSNSYNKEFYIDTNKTSRIKMNDDYRKLQSKLRSVMTNTANIDDSFSVLIKDVYRVNIENTNLIVSSIKKKIENNEEKLFAILNSYVHMFINRLFASNQRYTETTLYYYITKLYASEIAISKNSLSKNG